mmetsp:Transcript_13162/g.15238  ORF Transcript_13162/g.15238 Transcript_13162/m.15238 type:complete len:200 (-) Transcript_13162:522-1121(-)
MAFSVGSCLANEPKHWLLSSIVSPTPTRLILLSSRLCIANVLGLRKLSTATLFFCSGFQSTSLILRLLLDDFLCLDEGFDVFVLLCSSLTFFSSLRRHCMYGWTRSDSFLSRWLWNSCLSSLHLARTLPSCVRIKSAILPPVVFGAVEGLGRIVVVEPHEPAGHDGFVVRLEQQLDLLLHRVRPDVEARDLAPKLGRVT